MKLFKTRVFYEDDSRFDYDLVVVLDEKEYKQYQGYNGDSKKINKMLKPLEVRDGDICFYFNEYELQEPSTVKCAGRVFDRFERLQ